MNYDIIVIGGGIAGLYSAYKIQKLSPNTKVLVLEKNGKRGLGGRARVDRFHGTNILPGAGVGRKAKDKILIDLLKELNISTKEFLASSQYSSAIREPCLVEKMFLQLRTKYRIQTDSGKTFKQYATECLGKSTYDNFIICAGYTDYENEDAFGTLHYYGFDDNYSEWTGLSIDWNELIDKLAKNIHIKFFTNVDKIVKMENQFCIYGSNHTFLCNKVVIATTVDALRKLVPENDIYKEICGQPFLRVYGKFSAKSNQIMKSVVTKTTIVPGPIHKIIPMNTEKGIYMIIYSDNSGAEFLHKYCNNVPKNLDYLSRMLERSLNLEPGLLELLNIREYFWNVGTHFYKPLDRKKFKNRTEFVRIAQCPDPNVRIVGEMISMNQGWVEGALESVEKVIDSNWIHT